MISIGVDPSLRHTGICWIDEKDYSPHFLELKTEGLSIIDALITVQRQWQGIVDAFYKNRVVFVVERQVPQARMGAWMCTSMAVVLMQIKNFAPRSKIYLPYPVQLKSYMRKLGVDTSTKSSIVQSYKDEHNESGRVSSHKVEAFYLARMGQDIQQGAYHFRQPKKEVLELI